METATRQIVAFGGGSVVSLLGVWRAHRIDEILREAWRGASSSAGSRPVRSFWLNPGPSGVAEVELATAYLGKEPAQPAKTAAIAA